MGLNFNRECREQPHVCCSSGFRFAARLEVQFVFLIKGLTATIVVINENCVLVAAAAIRFPVVALQGAPKRLASVPSLLPALGPVPHPCLLARVPAISLLAALFLSPGWGLIC